MSSAWKSGRGYLAKFKPLIGKSCQRRVPKIIWANAADPDKSAADWAASCERICAAMQKDPAAVDVQKALKFGAINAAEATALLNDLPPPPDSAKLVTIEQAFFSHPSSKNDTGRSRSRYVDAMIAYTAWAKSYALHDLTLDLFTRYRDHLVKQGYAWDSRRHLMLPLRRASRMAAARFGMPDVLSGLRLDKPDRRPMAEAWTIDELRAALPSLDLRGKVAVGLGGFVGMRPSETIRIRCGDLRKDGRLPYGILPGRAKDAKNHASRRLLPIPETLAEWMRDLGDGRPATAPLLVTSPGNQPKEGGPNLGAKAFTGETFNQWLAPMLSKATGRALPVKCLRKVFATWTRREKIDPEHREVYLGHETDLAQSVTGQHYVADLYEVLADELDPTSEKLEARLHAATQIPKSRQAKANGG